MINTKLEKGGNLFTFLCLYIAQSIPTSFFATILPVILREQDVSLVAIGLINLVKLPWIFKFLWSPGIDRSSFKLIHYKRWIFSSELIYASIILAISFLNLETTPILIVLLVFFSFIASATQDIATDSLAVISFEKKDRSMVNTMQSVGNFVGVIVGSGLLLYVFDRLDSINRFSVWSNMLPYLALFVIIALVPLFFFRKNDNDIIIKEKQKEKPHINDVLGFFKQKNIWKQLVFLFLFYMGFIGTLTMIRPMLVDFGYSKTQIGTMIGIIGASIGCLGSISGGYIIRKLGKQKARILFSFCILIGAGYFSLLESYIPINTSTLHLGVCLLWGTYGMATLVVYTTAMDCVRTGYEGTDFTIQTVITHFSGMIMSALSGFIASEITYHGLFKVEFCIALVSFCYILWAFGWKERKNTTTTE